ncbi:winged helix-turn-helix domain-containing protein [Neptunicella marina]|uniref:Winged helix-turn-helix domain-containing protein n=1 Tax=Neptunicella marina TaxID=2125989 RepID=A0A8J6IRP8_9ALTE|nr:winged helix-turn-helix domain-containing protein [Neptunicella marina]MBC3765044.1 winged helix-turn-helix domain-containing protein [Neptunicella marina]
MATNKVQIKNIVVDFDRAEINKDGSIETLEPKLAAVLHILCKANGAIVSQQTLMDKVWGDVVVTPNTLQRCITQLRKLLGDDAKQQHMIKTHPKLGYSMAAPLLPYNELKPAVTPSHNKWIVLITALLFSALIMFWPASPTYPNLTKSAPVTLDGRNIMAITLSHQGDFMVFSRENNKQHQLVIQNTKTAQQTILADNLWIQGQLAVSPDDKIISFGLLTRFEKHKCVQLVNLEIVSRKITPLTGCSEGFAHSPVWLSNNSLAYINTGTDHLSQINVFNEKLQQPQLLSERYFATSQLFYSETNHTLGWLSDGKIWYTKWQNQQQKWTQSDSKELPKALKQASHASWFNQDTLLITDNNTLFWLHNFQLVKQQSLPLSSQILTIESDAMQHRFLLLQSRLDSSVNKRQFNQDMSFTDSMVSPSIYKEWKGKFQPDGDNIAFLSDRTGTSQIWLSGNPEQQLSHQLEDVTDFLWLNTHQHILISNQTLWVLNSAQQAHKLATEFVPLRLYQSIDGNILMSVLIKDKPTLITFNVNSGQYQKLLTTEVSWAQRINNTLLTADVNGNLSKFVDGKMQPITALPDLIIQSDFIVQNAFVYLQDKQLNVWRYDPVNELADVIGYYDENAMFMSDFNAHSVEMLSDNQQSETREAVWLSASPAN